MLRIFRRGETFFVNEKNQISYTTRDGFFVKPDDTWVLLGAVEYRTVFGRWQAVRRYTVEEIRAGKVPWIWKNGEQRCFVVDCDHGTTREWMSPTPYSATA